MDAGLGAASLKLGWFSRAISRGRRGASVRAGRREMAVFRRRAGAGYTGDRALNAETCAGRVGRGRIRGGAPTLGRPKTVGRGGLARRAWRAGPYLLDARRRGGLVDVHRRRRAFAAGARRRDTGSASVWTLGANGPRPAGRRTVARLGRTRSAGPDRAAGRRDARRHSAEAVRGNMSGRRTRSDAASVFGRPHRAPSRPQAPVRPTLRSGAYARILATPVSTTSQRSDRRNRARHLPRRVIRTGGASQRRPRGPRAGGQTSKNLGGANFGFHPGAPVPRKWFRPPRAPVPTSA